MMPRVRVLFAKKVDDPPEEEANRPPLIFGQRLERFLDRLAVPGVSTFDGLQGVRFEPNSDHAMVREVSTADDEVGVLKLFDHSTRPAVGNAQPGGELADRSLTVLVDVDRGPDRMSRHRHSRTGALFGPFCERFHLAVPGWRFGLLSPDRIRGM